MEFLYMLTEYASLINTALLISVIAIFFKLFNTYKTTKEAEVNVLKEQIENLRLFTAENVNTQLGNLKEWHEESIRQLEVEKEKAIKAKEKEFQELIENEINLRNQLSEKLNEEPNELFSKTDSSIEDYTGKYSVVGHNPGGSPSMGSYYGEIEITCSKREILVQWSIGRKQVFQGVGVLFENILSVYFTENGNNFHGVISYKLLSKEVLRGKWTGMGSKGLYGFEECRRT